MADSIARQTLRLVRKAGVLRPRDLDPHGISRPYLQRQSLVEVAQRLPNGVLCLLSALQFHGLTTQAPHKVWVALPTNAWRPRQSPVAT